jgi:hypothetical protein
MEITKVNTDSSYSLAVIETEWLDLYTEIRNCPERWGLDTTEISAPFLSSSLPGYVPGGTGTIMLVGKATSGDNTLGSSPVRGTYDATTVKLRTPAVVEEVLQGVEGSAWWRFARHLSDIAYRAVGTEGSPYTNMIWTNLIKIGVPRGNPPARLANLQADLAVETLLAEVKEYRPALLVMATGHYRNGLMCRALREIIESAPEEREQEKGWWAQAGVARRPAVLWAPRTI